MVSVLTSSAVEHQCIIMVSVLTSSVVEHQCVMVSVLTSSVVEHQCIIMVSVLTSNAVELDLRPKDYRTGICCFFAKTCSNKE